MRVGFGLFVELLQLAPCALFFPQAIAWIIGSGTIHKLQRCGTGLYRLAGSTQQPAVIRNCVGRRTIN